MLVRAGSQWYSYDADTGSIRGVWGNGPVSSDGRWLASQTTPRRGVVVIDTATGLRRRVLLPEGEKPQAISADGTLLAAYQSGDLSHPTDQKHFRLWNTQTGKQIWEVSTVPQSFSIFDFCISPDGQWIAGGIFGEDVHQIKLWKTCNGEEARSKDMEGYHPIGFTPDSKHLICVNYRPDQSAHVSILSTSDFAEVRGYAADDLRYGQVAISPVGKRIALATKKSEIVLKDLMTGRNVATFRGHKSSVTGIAFSADGQQIVTCSLDGTVKHWPVQNAKHIRTEERVSYISYSADGARLLLQIGPEVRLIDVESRETLTEYPANFAEIFPDGRRVALAEFTFEGTKSSTRISIANDSGKSLRSFDLSRTIRGLGVTPDGRRLLTGDIASIEVYDAESGSKVYSIPVEQPARGIGIDFSPDGRWLALDVENEDRIRLFDAETGEYVDSIVTDPEVRSTGWIEFSSDSRKILAAFESRDFVNNGIGVYDVRTRELIQKNGGLGRPVTAAWFMPDGRRIITASTDGRVRLWDVENGFELLSLRGDYGEGFSERGLAVAPSGHVVAVGSDSGVLFIEAATAEQVAEWNRAEAPRKDVTWWRRLGGIQDWLVLAPIRLANEEGLKAILDRTQLGDEAAFNPKEGETFGVNGQDSSWQWVRTDDWALDFEKAFGECDYCLTYAVSHIYSDQRRDGVRLLVGSDDLAKVYLNGELVHEYRETRGLIPGEDDIPIRLQEGKNVLVFKVVNKEGDWGASAQIVGEDYQPIPGVTTGNRP